MSYLSNIVQFINTAIADSIGKTVPFTNHALFGIAQLVKETSDEESFKIYPAMYVTGGEMSFAGIDDEHDLRIYHRALSIATGPDPKRPGFGNKQANDRNVAKMSMIVFGKRDILNMSPDDLFLTLQAVIPNKADKTTLEASQLMTAFININEVILNEEQVFNEEYKNIKYFLGPEHILIKINYQIESSFIKGCFNTTSCS